MHNSSHPELPYLKNKRRKEKKGGTGKRREEKIQTLGERFSELVKDTGALMDAAVTETPSSLLSPHSPLPFDKVMLCCLGGSQPSHLSLSRSCGHRHAPPHLANA